MKMAEFLGFLGPGKSIFFLGLGKNGRRHCGDWLRPKRNILRCLRFHKSVRPTLSEETVMPIETDFTFHHEHAARHALARAAPAPADFLGHLRGFVGGRPGAQNQRTWKGAGFNMIWRPTSAAGSGAQGFFLELNLTDETLSFNEISGNTGVANRGLLQQDIFLGAVAYVQTIKTRSTTAASILNPVSGRVCLTRPIPAKSHPWSGWVQFRMARRSICRGRRFRSVCAFRWIVNTDSV